MQRPPNAQTLVNVTRVTPHPASFASQCEGLCTKPCTSEMFDHAPLSVTAGTAGIRPNDGRLPGGFCQARCPPGARVPLYLDVVESS
jgi:hypothetical protein